MVKKHDLKIFALIWACIFMVIGLLPLINSGDTRIWSIAVSLLFAIVAFVKPELLIKFYTIWTKVGEFIGGIISKIVLFILFYGLFAPVAIFLRLIGKDLLNKKIDKSQESYWIEREMQPQSMKNQF